jgi:Flp pilus assembly protein TadG
MIHRLLDLLKDHRGLAAVEFAFVLPVMVALFCGLFEVSSGLIVYMKVIDAADAISDLVAQQKTVSSSDFDNFYLAGQLVMQPDSGSGLGVAIASVTFDPNTGDPSVAPPGWQVTRGGGAAMTDLTTAAVGLGAKGDSVIVAQATYTYTSLLKFFIPSGITITSRVFCRPRLTPTVTCPSPCS